MLVPSPRVSTDSAETSGSVAMKDVTWRGEDRVRTTRLIHALFPGPVSAHALWPTVPVLAPHEEERQLVRGTALRRQYDFGAGRTCAAHALQALGVAEAPLLIGENRAPVWPAGAVGSISHCPVLSVAVVASSANFLSLGVDVEQDSSLDDAVVAMVCRRDEIATFPTQQPLAGSWEKLSFSAKESIYKCYAPMTGSFLDFQDVRLLFKPNCTPTSGAFCGEIVNPSRPSIASRRMLEGRWWIGCGRVHTSAFLPPPS